MAVNQFELNRGGRSEAVMRYPAKQGNAPFVLFTRHRAQYSNAAAGGEVALTSDRIQGLQGTSQGVVLTEAGMVAMYMPMGISIGDSMMYDTASTGIIGNLIGGYMDGTGVGGSSLTEEKIQGYINDPSTLLDAATEFAGEVADDAASVGTQYGGLAAGSIAGAISASQARSLKALAALGLGSAALGVGVGTALQEANKAIQKSLNPREFLLFKAPTLRSFSMQFRFIPESAGEADTVDNIIKFFREGMYPEITQYGFGYKFPDAFQIQFKKVNGIPKLPEMFLENASITYNPNSMSYYKSADGGRPVEVSLALTFKELQPLNRQLIKRGGF